MRHAAVVFAVELAAPVVSAKPAPVTRVWTVCADAPSWGKLEKCLERFGKPTLERTFEHLKIVSVGENARQARAPGLYVYAERDSTLRLVTWQYAPAGAAELLDIRKVSVGGKRAYRLDIGTIESSVVVLDDETVLAATVQRKTAAFCLGLDTICASVVESCDVIVGGKAYYTFRGTVALEDGTVVVTGDRSRAGTCPTPERTPLVIGAR
jgi:hypothetical protein